MAPIDRHIAPLTRISPRVPFLEVVTSLNVTDFLRALRRFAARVGMPHSFVSDNATNFGATDRFLRELKEHPSISDFLTNHHSSWTFITPLAPWQGGMYERLVGITKSNLRKALYKRTPANDEFRTLCQVECVVQLTELNDPDYFIATTLRTQYQFLTDILQTFKRRWSHDYIINLRERHLRHSKPHQRGPRVHDLVLLVLDSVHRDQYPLARITRVLPGPGDVIRSVRVRSAKGEYERSITRIIPLEIDLDTGTSPHSPTENQEPPAEPSHLEEEIEPNTVDNGTKHAAVDPAENTREYESHIQHTPQQPGSTTGNDTPIETPTVSSTETTPTSSTNIRPRRKAAQQAKNWFTTLDE
ncbi:uncharacterized protein LOC143030213 [Oratosquilla oratoria]|uniref:uncharacterized protein LOC143030213 n=1 Tax=Oratosquilla oratoria TaxID=337810 RepID=UPI003F75EEA5